MVNDRRIRGSELIQESLAYIHTGLWIPIIGFLGAAYDSPAIEVPRNAECPRAVSILTSDSLVVLVGSKACLECVVLGPALWNQWRKVVYLL